MVFFRSVAFSREINDRLIVSNQVSLGVTWCIIINICHMPRDKHLLP